MFNSTEEFQVVSRKPKSDTVSLTINQTKVNVCKRWINDSCTIKNCINYHPTVKICSFYTKGICKWGISCYLLHPIELQAAIPYHKEQYSNPPPDNSYRNVWKIKEPPKGCLTITVNNQKICVCERWVDACRLPYNARETMSCVGLHPKYHPIKQHLTTPICEKYLHGKCFRGLYCYYLHPPELEFKSPKTNSTSGNMNSDLHYEHKLNFTAMCVKQMIHNFDKSQPACTYFKCKFAHSLNQINSHGDIKSFDENLKNHTNKIPLQQVFSEIYMSIKNNITVINNYRNNNSLPTISCPEPVPKNFVEMINMWIDYTSYARKNNDPNKLTISDESENIIWALSKRLQLCETDLKLGVQILINNTPSGFPKNKITKECLCIHGQNCKKGTHISNYDETTGYLNLICLDELMGNCKCQIKSGQEAIHQRQRLYKEFDQIKEKYNNSQPDQRQHLQNLIYRLATKIVNTYCKIHLIKDYNYKQLQPATAVIKDIIFDITEEDFIHLPQLSEEDIVNLKIKNDEHQEMKNKLIKFYAAKNKIFNFLKLRIIKKLSHNLKTNKDRISFILSGSYKWISFEKYNKLTMLEKVYYGTGVSNLISYNEFIIDFKTSKIFKHWYHNSLNCDFLSYKKDVLNKMTVWDDAQEDVSSEVRNPFDKNNFSCFWSWYYNIDLVHDVIVTGSLSINIIESIYDLFLEFVSKYHPTYRITFSTWIASNEYISRIVNLVKISNLTFKQAENYIKLKLDETIMSFKRFFKI